VGARPSAGAEVVHETGAGVVDVAAGAGAEVAEVGAVDVGAVVAGVVAGVVDVGLRAGAEVADAGAGAGAGA
jgi:hypothetical protein